MRVIDDMNVGWRILLWPEVALHPDYPFKDELPYNFRHEDDKYSRFFCYNGHSSNLSSSTYTVKKGVFPVDSLDVTNRTLPGQELLNYSQPGRVWLVTSRGAGKTITFLTM
jgi:hypothetical protein